MRKTQPPSMKDIPNTHPLKRPEEVKHFQDSLLVWYDLYKRELPWRSNPSLYKTVISEFMLNEHGYQLYFRIFEELAQKISDFQALACAASKKCSKHGKDWGTIPVHAIFTNLQNLRQTGKYLLRSNNEWKRATWRGSLHCAAVTSIALGKARSCL